MLTPEQVMDNYYLEARCQLLEVAATLDRFDRAAEAAGQGSPASDPRLERLYASLSILADREGAPDRSERLLNHFSGPVS